MRSCIIAAAVAIQVVFACAPPAVADAQWQPVEPSQAPPSTRVQGDIDVAVLHDAVEVSGWVVDGFSATRPDRVEVRDELGQLLGLVVSGQFQRRREVEQLFGSSAFSLSGFDVTIPNPPRSLIVLAHLGQLGWWQAYVTAPVQSRANLASLRCVAPDSVEVEVTSADVFPVRNALLELTVGDQVTATSRYAPGGDLHTVIFELSADQLAAISPSDDAYVSFDPPSPLEHWEIGSIDPASIRPCEQN